MAEYVKREEVIEDLARLCCAQGANRGICEKCGFFKYKSCSSYETAERLYNAGYRQTEPAVNAHWEIISNSYIRCSHCKQEDFVRDNVKPRRCRKCGAIMDLEV